MTITSFTIYPGLTFLSQVIRNHVLLICMVFSAATWSLFNLAVRYADFGPQLLINGDFQAGLADWNRGQSVQVSTGGRRNEVLLNLAIERSAMVSDFLVDSLGVGVGN